MGLDQQLHEGTAAAKPLFLADESRWFVVEEYKALRTEIIINIQANHMVERDVVIASLAVFSFVYAAKSAGLQVFDSGITLVAAFIPTLLASLGWYRTWATTQSILKIGGYLLKLEKSIPGISENLLGWEEYMHTFRQEVERRHDSFAFELYQRMFWLSVIAVNLLVGMAICFVWWIGGARM